MVRPVNDKTAADILSSNGIRPSIQRTLIYQALCAHNDHPTAEMIYLRLSPSMPTLSRTTVYNTLKLFAEKKLVESLHVDGDEVRYDADTVPHLHLKCGKCGQVYDAATGHNERKFLCEFYEHCGHFLPDGFRAEKIQTCFWGECGSCRFSCQTKSDT